MLQLIAHVCTVCPRSPDPYSIVSYYIIRVETSWDIQYAIFCIFFTYSPVIFLQLTSLNMLHFFCKSCYVDLSSNITSENFCYMDERIDYNYYTIKNLSYQILYLFSIELLFCYIKHLTTLLLLYKRKFCCDQKKYIYTELKSFYSTQS